MVWRRRCLREVVRGSRARPMRIRMLLVSIACSAPPSGRCRWTLSLLAERWGGADGHGGGCHWKPSERMKANQLKPWQRKMWCLGQMDAAYIAQMEHILDLYAEAPSPDAPLVNFDEATKQLVGEVNAGRPMTPGQASAKRTMNMSARGLPTSFCALTVIVAGVMPRRRTPRKLPTLPNA